MDIRGGFLYTVTKYGDLPTLAQIGTALRELRNYGYTCAELEGRDPTHLMMLEQHREELRALCQELGMRVVNFVMMVPGTSSLDSVVRASELATFARAAELARFFGARTMEVDTFPPPLAYQGDPTEPETLRTSVDVSYSWAEQWDVCVQLIREYARVAAGAGCLLQVHARIGEVVSNTDGMLRLLDAVEEDNLGFVLDTAQLHVQKEILPLSVEKLGGRIWSLHVSDNDGSIHMHRRLGQGTVDWDGLWLALKKHRFQWDIGVDIANYGTIEDDYRESRCFLEELANRHGLA